MTDISKNSNLWYEQPTWSLDSEKDSGKKVLPLNIPLSLDSLEHVKIAPQPEERPPPLVSESCYFDDGKRSIDLVLAYQPRTHLAQKSATKRREVVKAKYRDSFVKSLKESGLELEFEGLSTSQDGKTCFIKIHGTWEFLSKNAERLGVKVALSEMDIRRKTSWTERLLTCFGKKENPFRLNNLEDLELKDYFSMKFDRKRLECYNVGDKETFWSKPQRVRLVDHEVQRIAIVRLNPESITEQEIESFGRSGSEGVIHLPISEECEESEESGEDEEKVSTDKEVAETFRTGGPARRRAMLVPAGGELELGKVTFQWLLKQKVFTSAFCLHDCDLDEADEYYLEARRSKRPVPMRLFLRDTWGSWKRWTSYQPLDHIYEYFGSEIALYFAWLGFYTKQLTVLATCSLLCLGYGLYNVSRPFVMDICRDDRLGLKMMCRLCPNPGCEYTHLNKHCTFAVFASIFDNEFTPLYAFLTSVWAICFLEFWKRYQASLAAKWGTDDTEEAEVVMRPDYQYGVKTARYSPVTGYREVYLPTPEKVRRMGISIAATGCLIVVVLVFVMAVIAYRSVGLFVWYKLAGKNWFINLIGGPSMVTSITAAALNGVFIVIMSAIFPMVAHLLTKFEYPRTQADFDSSYIYKMIIFEFINFYGIPFYLAFFKGKLNTNPLNATKLDTFCPPSGCMTDLCIQLLVVMTGKQMLQNVKELGFPTLKNWLRKRAITVKVETEENPFDQWEKDFTLEPMQEPVAFDDYLEMVIQYGFLTMFAPAFPLAAFFALLNNIFEIRIDAVKYLNEYQLPIPAQVKTIGVWGDIITAVTRVSVVINAFIIAFTTEFVDKLVFFVQEGTLQERYLNSTLTLFETKYYGDQSMQIPYTLREMQHSKEMNETIEHCYFRSYFETASHNFVRTSQWWIVYLAKLLFVVVFEHLVFSVQYLIEVAIPDVPEHIKTRELREQYLVKRAFMKAERRSALRRKLKQLHGAGKGGSLEC